MNYLVFLDKNDANLRRYKEEVLRQAGGENVPLAQVRHVLVERFGTEPFHIVLEKAARCFQRVDDASVYLIHEGDMVDPKPVTFE